MEGVALTLDSFDAGGLVVFISAMFFFNLVAQDRKFCVGVYELGVKVKSMSFPIHFLRLASQ